ncbi:MAG: outer membrane protein assembly factor BamD [Melioribacteraceae bacterium]|nr:outer membrane protein assembly factor BamD [Melioribacteraceae bacterium]
MKKFLFAGIIIILAAGCSGTRNTANMTPSEHFDYAMELYNDEEYELCLNEFQTILLQYPASTVNDDAQYYLGMTYFNREQYLLAAYEFSKLIRNITASSFVPQAQFMLAESYYQLSPPPPLDQTYTRKAIDEFQAFIDFFPVDPRVEEAEKKIKEMNTKLAEKEYRSAVIYEKMEYFNAAIDYYQLVLDTYHDTQYAPMALYNKIQLELAKDRREEVLNDITDFLQRYPEHPRADELSELQNTLLAGNE